MRWFPRSKEKRAMDAQAFITGLDMAASPIYGASAVSMSRALRLTPVYASTRLLADDAASLPLQAYRKSGGVKQEIDLPPYFRQPQAEGQLRDFVFQAVASLALRGNVYGLHTGFDRMGYPTGTELLNPEDVVVDKLDGRWVFFYEGRQVPREELFHVAGFTLPGCPVGLSPIQAYAMTVDTGLYAAQFGRDWFRNGSTPAAVLESDQPITTETAEVLKERFKRAARDRDVVAMGAGAKYKPISVAANESQFIETMKMSATQIASVYGLRPERIGGDTGSSMTYKNVEMNSIEDANAVRPYVLRLEAAFNALTPRPQYLKFNMDANIRADLATRYAAHRVALGDGVPFLTVDEVRDIEDRTPLPPSAFPQPLAPSPAPPTKGPAA